MNRELIDYIFKYSVVIYYFVWFSITYNPNSGYSQHGVTSLLHLKKSFVLFCSLNVFVVIPTPRQ